jgi:hypothetical protein
VAAPLGCPTSEAEGESRAARPWLKDEAKASRRSGPLTRTEAEDTYAKIKSIRLLFA